MPLTHDYCSKLIIGLEKAREEKEIDWIRPDGKAQVTVEYRK